ncbi:cobalamin B12-binding domain-containing protein [Nonomuraea gerenzanensis]|uniref:5-methyltetrahydrofolate--homocysteine methyltransferase n=1 Tax=Nonomuraea gerenzanensis TaxID=93944 RepID=A0A1M4EQZ8_9ACTN|nr:cobalamin-dependent protein [Nonomuraea gerenzanensis]UBU12478.1 cobalamin-dependent protein [Nonomuraea gerenzanensis]SBP01033.1 5-methyltetrahydrofolate--homocysteine methyltransferase [Nonomuraea gerenzanensis]
MTGEAEQWTEALWAAARAGDEHAATGVAMAALDAGLPMETLLLDVVAAVQARVGHEWAANHLSVAQEHSATALNERVLSALAHRLPRRDDPAASRGRIMVACIDGEWHAFPARLLAEVLQVRGWQVDYLGAQVPTPHLVAHLHLTNPDAVALSSSLAIRLPAAHTAITACQAAGKPVVVGGAAFGPDGRYARLLGADAWAPDARAAADLLAAGPLPRRTASGEEPRLLADREYTELTRSAGDLVGGIIEELGRGPELAGCTEQQLWQLAEEVAYLVDFLRAALYVDDPELFSAFVGWMRSVLTARDIPPALLPAVLEALSGRLGGFPRALGMVAGARGSG